MPPGSLIATHLLPPGSPKLAAMVSTVLPLGSLILAARVSIAGAHVAATVSIPPRLACRCAQYRAAEPASALYRRSAPAVGLACGRPAAFSCRCGHYPAPCSCRQGQYCVAARVTIGVLRGLFGSFPAAILAAAGSLTLVLSKRPGASGAYVKRANRRYTPSLSRSLVRRRFQPRTARTGQPAWFAPPTTVANSRHTRLPTDCLIPARATIACGST